jgi:hypothetical protein
MPRIVREHAGEGTPIAMIAQLTGTITLGVDL